MTCPVEQSLSRYQREIDDLAEAEDRFEKLKKSEREELMDSANIDRDLAFEIEEWAQCSKEILGAIHAAGVDNDKALKLLIQAKEKAVDRVLGGLEGKLWQTARENRYDPY